MACSQCIGASNLHHTYVSVFHSSSPSSHFGTSLSSSYVRTAAASKSCHVPLKRRSQKAPTRRQMGLAPFSRAHRVNEKAAGAPDRQRAKSVLSCCCGPEPPHAPNDACLFHLPGLDSHWILSRWRSLVALSRLANDCFNLDFGWKCRTMSFFILANNGPGDEAPPSPSLLPQLTNRPRHVYRLRADTSLSTLMNFGGG